jgi:hypothetical protein
VQGSVPREAFTASWNPAPQLLKKATPVTKSPSEGKHSQWNAILKYQLTIQPESIATITAVSRGAPHKGAMYLEGIGLKRGSDSFAQVPDGLVGLDANECFQVKIANTTTRRIIVRSGELLGHLYKADNTLKAATDMTP